MRPTPRTLVSIVIATLGATTLSATGFAVGAADNRNEPPTIEACAAKSDGALRLLTGQTCRKRERKVAWARQGDQGQPGATGAAGTNGTNGTNGVSGYEIVADSQSVAGSSSLIANKIVPCPAGKKAVGGGAAALNSTGTPIGTGTFLVRSSIPSPDGTNWNFTVEMTSNPAGSISTIAYRVICVVAS